MSGLVILGYAFGGFAIFAGLLCLIGSAGGGNRIIPCVPPPLKAGSVVYEPGTTATEAIARAVEEEWPA